jgi:aryl-alcohol dehydrogenase-like predicted oxidoreductase
LRELGIALVAWSPLGAGFLTGTVDTLGANDFRQYNPRFAGPNLATNTDRYAPVMQIARELSVTPAQVALAWLLHQGDDVIPIPGTRKAQRIDENAQASTIRLDAQQLRTIDALARPGLAEGQTLV